MRLMAGFGALCIALTACTTGGTGDVAVAAKPRAVGSASTSSGAFDVPAAQMQVGTAFAKGALVRACGARGCEDGPARPRRTLRADEERLLMFVVAKQPKAAAVQVRRKRSGKLVDEQPLEPGTTMPYPLELKDGRYVVSLDAEWRGLRARWIFALTVERS